MGFSMVFSWFDLVCFLLSPGTKPKFLRGFTQQNMLLREQNMAKTRLLLERKDPSVWSGWVYSSGRESLRSSNSADVRPELGWFGPSRSLLKSTLERSEDFSAEIGGPVGGSGLSWSI